MSTDTQLTIRRPEPIVSIIVAAYNCEDFLPDTIASVRSQIFQNFELIIVDDGSTDKTLEVARRCSASDDRISIIHQKNSGTAAGARNTGLSLARGKYVCFLDGDDLYSHTKLGCQVQFMSQHPELGITFHDIQFIDVAGNAQPGTYLTNSKYIEKAGATLKQISEDCFLAMEGFYPFMTSEITGIHTSSVMIRRIELLNEEQVFVSTAPVGEDIDLWFRLASRCKVGYINTVHSFYRQHPSSVTRDNEKLLTGWIWAHTRNLKRAYHRLSPSQITTCKDKIARQYANLAYEQRRQKRFGSALLSYGKSLIHSFDPDILVAMLKTLIHPGARH